FVGPVRLPRKSSFSSPRSLPCLLLRSVCSLWSGDIGVSRTRSITFGMSPLGGSFSVAYWQCSTGHGLSAQSRHYASPSMQPVSHRISSTAFFLPSTGSFGTPPASNGHLALVPENSQALRQYPALEIRLC